MRVGILKGPAAAWQVGVVFLPIRGRIEYLFGDEPVERITDGFLIHIGAFLHGEAGKDGVPHGRRTRLAPGALAFLHQQPL